MPTMTYTETLVVTSCWCGVKLAIPQDLESYARRRKNHSIFCPLGHEFVYGNTVEEQNEKLKADLERAHERTKATRDLLFAEERAHRATKGHVTRMKKRASAGVCPCCNRSFQNVARHMSTKHPEYASA